MTTWASRRRAAWCAVGSFTTSLVLIASSPAARADDSLEEKLAERYAPVVHLVEQTEPCGSGEPYKPGDVDELLGNDSIALRGPWTQQDLILIAPDASDLSRPLVGYSLDLPGNPLDPGCSYEQWAEQVWSDSPPTVYAHVAREVGRPGELALQYWFFYPFNDFNNKHEGDWERIQLEFETDDVSAALEMDPTRLVYSQHEGAERATWGDDKLEITGGTHPAVYVSGGSHASRYSSDVFLLRSTSQGFGCDATLGAATGATPVVRTIPSDPVAASRQYPWLDYRGTWGQREDVSFYSGPTGPATKSQWTKPFTWADRAADTSYTVPGGRVYGVRTTDFFCSVVGKGSVLLLRYNDNPFPPLAVLALIAGLVLWLVRRTSWSSRRPLPVEQRRDFGEVVAVAWATYTSHARLFLSIGSVVAAVSLASGLGQQLLASAPDPADASNLTTLQTVAGAAGSLALLLTVFLSSSATVHALVELDAGRDVRARDMYREALSRSGALASTLLLAGATMVPLLLSLYLAPLLVLLVVAWTLIVPVVQLEGRMGFDALRRSWHLARHQLLRMAGLLLLGLLLLVLLGGLLGSLILVAVQAPFAVVNLVPGVTNALVGPFVSLMIGYSYFHGRILEASPSATSAPRDARDRRGDWPRTDDAADTGAAVRPDADV